MTSKILFVAHPDDEILWFNPAYFDKIFIFFCDRNDRPAMKEARLRALSEHPFVEKIDFIKLDEPGLFKDKNKIKEFEVAYHQVKSAMMEIKKTMSIAELFTHNSKGEYGHYDHILLHYAALEIFGQEALTMWCPTQYFKTNQIAKLTTREIPNDRKQFRQIRDVYLKHDAWTWNDDYLPGEHSQYYLANSDKAILQSLDKRDLISLVDKSTVNSVTTLLQRVMLKLSRLLRVTS